MTCPKCEGANLINDSDRWTEVIKCINCGHRIYKDIVRIVKSDPADEETVCRECGKPFPHVNSHKRFCDACQDTLRKQIGIVAAVKSDNRSAREMAAAGTVEGWQTVHEIVDAVVRAGEHVTRSMINVYSRYLLISPPVLITRGKGKRGCVSVYAPGTVEKIMAIKDRKKQGLTYNQILEERMAPSPRHEHSGAGPCPSQEGIQ